MTNADRRVLVVSNRKRLTGPAFTGLFEFENLICEWEGADLVTLPHHRGDTRYDLPRSIYQGLRKFHVPATSALQATRLGRSLPLPQDHYDLVVIVAGSIFDLFSASWLAHNRSRFERVVAVALEAWPPQIGPGAVDLEPFDFFDRIFVGLAEGTRILSERYPHSFELMRPATNVLRYETSVHRSRPNLAVSLGRSNPNQTAAARGAAAARQQGVVDDSNAVPATSDITVHRRNYAAMLTSADLMICNYAKFDLPATIGTAREVPMRFFEALAAGCIPAGASPGESEIRNADLEDAIRFDLALDGSADDILKQLPAPGDWPELRRRNRRLALESHDWSNRWRQVLASLGLEAPAILDHRRSAISAEVEKLISGS